LASDFAYSYDVSNGNTAKDIILIGFMRTGNYFYFHMTTNNIFGNYENFFIKMDNTGLIIEHKFQEYLGTFTVSRSLGQVGTNGEFFFIGTTDKINTLLPSLPFSNS